MLSGVVIYACALILKSWHQSCDIDGDCLDRNIWFCRGLDNTKVALLNSRSISCRFGPLKWAYKAFAIVFEAVGRSYGLLSVSLCKSFSDSRGYSASFQEEKVISYAQAKDGSYFFPCTHCAELFLFLLGEQETASWLISSWAANANMTERKKKKSK